MSISLGSTSISNAYLGSSAASAIYLGNTQVWTSTITIGPNTIYLGGLGGLNPAFLQSQLEDKLDGETITSFTSQGNDVYATSTSNFTILGTNVYAFNSLNLTAYEDGGRCTQIATSSPTAFLGCTSLRSVTMPSCSIVGDSAFYNNSSLTTVNLPLATSIGRNAFNGCSSLIEISLPSATAVGVNAFNNCPVLTSLDLPAVTTIPDYRFQNITSLVTASFASATTVGQRTFQQNYSLSDASTFPELLSIGTSSFQSCKSLVDTAPMFPKVTTIADLAFYGCTNYNNFTGLTSASFVSASRVGDGAFFGCNYLKYINLPALSGPTALGGTTGTGRFGVFGSVYTYGTANVPSDYLSNNGGKPDGDLLPLVGRNQDGTIDPNSQYNWTINYLPTDKIFIGGAGALSQAALESILTGETITYYAEEWNNLHVSSSTNYSINGQAFLNENIPLDSYIDGGKCTSIGEYAFLNTTIQTASFANVTAVYNGAFLGTPLAILNMPKLVTAAYSAFEGTAIVTADLPELTTVGDRAFLGCYALQNIRAEKVTSIGQYAFANDTQLTSLSFPNATSVGLGAFHANTALTYLDLPGLVGPNALGGSPGNNGVFDGVSSLGSTIRVPRYYQTNNGGGVDGDIQYLINLGWFIVWVELPNPTIVIGTQQWTVTDLDVTEYANGETIPEVTDETEWSNLTTGAWCWYNNDDTKTKLYNWYAVNDQRGLAPAGFHIPTDAEWTTLTDYLGADAGGQLKEAGLDHWIDPNTGATNSSGFTGLPGGSRSNAGTFSGIGAYGFWWSSTEYLATYPWYRFLSSDLSDVNSTYAYKTNGFSVRLIKD